MTYLMLTAVTTVAMQIVKNFNSQMFFVIILKYDNINSRFQSSNFSNYNQSFADLQKN